MRNYRAAARQFARQADPLSAGPAELALWRRRIEEGNPPAAASTVNVKIVALRAFFSFLQARGLRADNPAEALKLRRAPERLPKPIPEADVPKILAAACAPSDGPQALQERAVVETFLGGGLRGSEVANLRLGHVLDREFLKVIGKGDKERLVPMTDAQYEALRDWALAGRGDEASKEVEGRFGKDAAFLDLSQRCPERAFFLNHEGTPLPELRQPRNVVYKIWKRVCRRAGVREYNPHRARHAVATDLLNNGADIRLVQQMLVQQMLGQQMLGHRDIRTTLGYTKVTKSGLRTLRGFHSRSRMEI